MVSRQDRLPDFDVPPNVWVQDKLAERYEARQHQKRSQQGGERNDLLQQRLRGSLKGSLRRAVPIGALSESVLSNQFCCRKPLARAFE